MHKYWWGESLGIEMQRCSNLLELIGLFPGGNKKKTASRYSASSFFNECKQGFLCGLRTSIRLSTIIFVAS
jgi:hypothetical protein